MKISKEHIDNLYQFTRQHYVVHYDLQTELVDHLANDIEAIWEEHPNLSFNDARDLSFKKFCVFGFMDVVESSLKKMSKRYRLISWEHLKEWFQLPKLIITVLIFLVSLSLFSLKEGETIAVIAFYIVVIGSFLLNYKYLKYVKRKEKQKEKLWLLEDIIFRSAAMGDVLLVSNILNIRGFVVLISSVSSFKYLTALIFTLLLLYSYVKTQVIPKNAEKLLKKTYPEFSL